MAVLALDTWTWIGIAALGWCVFSFGFALWLGGLIHASEQAAQPTAPRRRSDYGSGMQLNTDIRELAPRHLQQAEPTERRDATGSHR